MLHMAGWILFKSLKLRKLSGKNFLRSFSHPPRKRCCACWTGSTGSLQVISARFWWMFFLHGQLPRLVGAVTLSARRFWSTFRIKVMKVVPSWWMSATASAWNTRYLLPILHGTKWEVLSLLWWTPRPLSFGWCFTSFLNRPFWKIADEKSRTLWRQTSNRMARWYESLMSAI